MRIIFDEEGIRNEITNYFSKVMSDLVELIKNRMIENIENIPDSGSYSAVGASEWRQDVAEHMEHDVKIYTHLIVARAGLLYHKSDDDNLLKQAMLINYGMGNLMDLNNPFLSKYLASEYYDKKRVGNNVYTRPEEEVYDYETDTYGWKMSTAKIRHEIPYFRQSPSHFYEGVEAEIEDEFRRIANNFLNVIDFDKYIRME